jgi:hypothetical protein
MGQRRDYRVLPPAVAQWRRMRFWLLVGVVIFGTFIGFVKFAKAHGWYPHECCHDRDCSEIISDRVRTEPGGYVIDGRFHVAQRDVRTSRDGNYHACFPQPDRLLCFFAPPQGS